jgi:hypothetical protein
VLNHFCFLSKRGKELMGQKATFSTRLDEDRVKELMHLAVDTEKPLGNLLDEAVLDLLKKYQKKSEK